MQLEESKRQMVNNADQHFDKAPLAELQRLRSYARRPQDGTYETFDETCKRTLHDPNTGLAAIGQLTQEELTLVDRMQRDRKAFGSARWLWVGGTKWIAAPDNYAGAFNCSSFQINDWNSFALLMDLAMQGSGTGAILEKDGIEQLPTIKNRLFVCVVGQPGDVAAQARQEQTQIKIDGSEVHVTVGDSREGWVAAYETLLRLAAADHLPQSLSVIVELGHVRPHGEKLKAFGGVANPIRLPQLFPRMASILNKAVGRQLTSVECCLLIDEAASTVVAGNIRRSAGMRQGASDDEAFAVAKDNLWQQDEAGNWRIDPERDALRMANHTRVYHHKPTEQECVDAVRKQFYSGEGAIQWAGEAVRRANADVLATPEQQQEFLWAYDRSRYEAKLYLKGLGVSEAELEHRLARYGMNPCVPSDTWVMTEQGPRQVGELIGTAHNTYVNGELYASTPDGFFYTGNKTLLKVVTNEGYELRLTSNHPVLKLKRQTNKSQQTEWCEAGLLQVGDKVMVNNHRTIQPWDGEGTFNEGWLLGNLIGNGTFETSEAILSFWGEHQLELHKYAVKLLREEALCGSNVKDAPSIHPTNATVQVKSRKLFDLAQRFGINPVEKAITPAIERGSYEFYRGFLSGLFGADGSPQGIFLKGISVRLSQSDLPRLQACQRMLLRLGIASTIYQERHKAKKKWMPSSDRTVLKEYDCKANHELAIANDNLYWFHQLIPFAEPSKKERLDGYMKGYKRRLNRERFVVTIKAVLEDGVEPVYDCTIPEVSRFDANGLVVHNCGEIIGADFMCNLSSVHLNQLDPLDLAEQAKAFRASALQAASLLNRGFTKPRIQWSRELDPIVGVSFTGAFTFFVKAFGLDWLRWWEAGRPEHFDGSQETCLRLYQLADSMGFGFGIGYDSVAPMFIKCEQAYLSLWKTTVHETVWDYCDRHQLKRPNRCTTLKPEGSLTLLTGVGCNGFHPPKGWYYIRRMTFAKDDPIAVAAIRYGYNVVPSQSDKDAEGNLLNDPYDPRCTEWLVEVPVMEEVVHLFPEAATINPNDFSALAQFDWYMQIQRYYTQHNTSATLELRQEEIEPLAKRIYQAIANDEGYISACLLARYDSPYPRLPFEVVSKERYLELMAEVRARRESDDFQSLLPALGVEQAPQDSACNDGRCALR